MVTMTEEPEDFEGKWPDMDRACEAFEAADCPGDRGRGNLEFKLRAALAVLCPLQAERNAAAERDYADMRRFQARYIEADHARLALIVDVQRLRDALKPFAAIDLTTNQAVDAMDVLRARRALEGGE